MLLVSAVVFASAVPVSVIAGKRVTRSLLFAPESGLIALSVGASGAVISRIKSNAADGALDAVPFIAVAVSEFSPSVPSGMLVLHAPVIASAMAKPDHPRPCGPPRLAATARRAASESRPSAR